MLNFMGIGAQKAGTTWLYERLAAHPQIGFPGGKEVHYWDARATLPESWYCELFATDDGRVNGDITPAYATLEPPVVDRIGALFPDLRIIFLLRNPIERAWSAALMALGRAELTLDDASDAWFLDHFRSRGSLLRGDYGRTLDIWGGVFPASALLVLFYEDLCRRPTDLLHRVATFLGVTPDPSWTPQRLAAPVFAGPGAPLRPTLRKPLLELYRPRIVALEARLGRDLRHWYGDGE
ncbi:MAG: sulfotransferase [Porticoccaceae bacterium]